ncbi:S-layer-like array protein [Methanosarcina siciliae T4/M]|uniref:S-layer-like array protein n=1 Tax=Methanosarcina siciliae T4/M TaxID=1434120 RepID=A0A0E3P440_9EURY|nr:PEGA domain-containing protein [Methanosarcina siciliae]AKB27272.1 S-layer-like array protein [Methanosarcina siciliae T4/M]
MAFRKALICTVFSFLILTLAVGPVFADVSAADPGQGNSTVKETENSTVVDKGDSGNIKITTVPNGSEIYINEIPVGKTPALIEDVPSGFYEVVLKQDGYEDVFERVTVTAGETYSISKKLRISRWTYSVSSSPSGAKVYLDGGYKGVTPVVFNAEGRQHKLTIKKTGYGTVSKEINASDDPSILIEEKLHISLLTYLAATLVLLAAGVYIKRNPEKLKFKSPKKIPVDRTAIEKLRKTPEKKEEKGKEKEKTGIPDSGKKDSIEGTITEISVETSKDTSTEATKETSTETTKTTAETTTEGTKQTTVEEDKKSVPANEKTKGELSGSDGLVELEKLSEPDFEYTIKKKE